MGRFVKGNEGFTLVELLMVVTIIGVLAGIATIGSRDMRARFRLKEAANSLYGDLQLTRLGAIRTGRPWAICFFPGEVDFTSYSIGNADGADGDICTAADDPTSTADPAVYRKNVDLSSTGEIQFSENFSGTRITFDPRGSASAGNLVLRPLGSVLVTGRRITVNGMTGSVRVDTFNL